MVINARGFIHGLKINTIIGTKDQERIKPQPIILDLEFEQPMLSSVNDDHLKRVIDYEQLSQYLINYVSQTNFKLIETLATEIIKKLKSEFNIGTFSLTVHKPQALPSAEDVGIIVSSD